MANLVASSNGQTRGGRAIARASNGQIALVTGAANTSAHFWQAASPYTSWTDSGALPATSGGGFQINNGNVSLALDSSNNIALAGYAGAGGYGFDDNGYDYGTWGTSTWTSFGGGVYYGDNTTGGPTAVVVLPNGHAWYAGVDQSGGSLWAPTSGQFLVAATSSVTTGTTISSGTNNAAYVANSITASGSNPLFPTITYTGSGPYTLWLFVNDGTGALKYASFADSASTYPSTLTWTQLNGTATVKNDQLSVARDSADGIHVAYGTGSGINYMYRSSAGTWYGPFTVSSSSSDTYPVVTTFGSAHIAITYVHNVSANKNNITYVTANISTSPTFSGTTDIFTDAGTNSAQYPSAEAVSSTGTDYAVAYTYSSGALYQAIVTPSFGGATTNTRTVTATAALSASGVTRTVSAKGAFSASGVTRTVAASVQIGAGLRIVAATAALSASGITRTVAASVQIGSFVRTVAASVAVTYTTQVGTTTDTVHVLPFSGNRDIARIPNGNLLMFYSNGTDLLSLEASTATGLATASPKTVVAGGNRDGPNFTLLGSGEIFGWDYAGSSNNYLRYTYNTSTQTWGATALGASFTADQFWNTRSYTYLNGGTYYQHLIVGDTHNVALGATAGYVAGASVPNATLENTVSYAITAFGTQVLMAGYDSAAYGLYYYVGDALTATSTHQTVSWTQLETGTGSDAAHYQNNLAAHTDSNGNAWLFWQDGAGMAVRVLPAGVSAINANWSSKVRVGNNATDDYPNLTADQHGNMWAVWMDGGAGNTIYAQRMAYSTGSGAIVLEGNKVALSYGSATRVYVSSIDSDANNLYAVWCEGTNVVVATYPFNVTTGTRTVTASAALASQGLTRTVSAQAMLGSPVRTVAATVGVAVTGITRSVPATVGLASVIVEDNFTRANQTGWGTSTNTDNIANRLWKNYTASWSTITSNTGQLLSTPDTVDIGWLGDGVTTHRSVDGLVKFSLSAPGSEYFGIVLYGNGTDTSNANLRNSYIAYWRGPSTEFKSGYWDTSGTGNFIQEVTSTRSITAGQAYWMRLQVIYNSATNYTIHARLWQDGTAEPGTWDITWTDNAIVNLSNLGYSGLFIGTGGANTATVNSFTVTDLASTTTNTRTVGASVQLSASGVTRTVGATGALTKLGITRTVTATSALTSLGLTRTVGASVPLVSTNVRNVGASAALTGQGLVRSVSATGALTSLGLTRTVGATSALVSTNTRTVAATSALTSLGITRTVGAKGALTTLGLTRTVGATSALASTNVRTVSATAQMGVAGSNTRTVAATVGLSQAGILRTVPGIAALTTLGITRTVGASVPLISTNVRTVGATGALRATNTRTVAATGALLQTGILRTAPGSVGLTILGITRTVGASVPLVSTNTRTVSSTVAFSGGNPIRSVPATVALSQAGILRSVTAFVPLVSTNVRTVPGSAGLISTTLRGVTAGAALSSTNVRTVPAVGALTVLGISRTVPAATDFLTTNQRTVPASFPAQTTTLRTVQANTAFLASRSRTVAASVMLRLGSVPIIAAPAIVMTTAHMTMRFTTGATTMELTTGKLSMTFTSDEAE